MDQSRVVHQRRVNLRVSEVFLSGKSLEMPSVMNFPLLGDVLGLVSRDNRAYSPAKSGVLGAIFGVLKPTARRAVILRSGVLSGASKR